MAKNANRADRLRKARARIVACHGRNLDLSRLQLRSEDLAGLISEIASLPALQNLDLNHNMLVTLPAEVRTLTALNRLDLRENQLTLLPPEIGELRTLQLLDLSGNLITELPSEISSLTALQILHLDDNQLTELPPEIGSLTALEHFTVSENQLPLLPSEIGSLSALKILNLDDNQLTELPPEIGSLTALVNLDIDRNQITKLPSEIGTLVALTSLELFQNQLIELPHEIGKLKALRYLDLSRNLLTVLPPEIGGLTGLMKLELYGNNLVELPPQIGGLVKLQTLDLRENQLASLTPEIGELHSLETLNLCNNQLTTLPESLRKLKSLFGLFLHENAGLGLPLEVIGPQSRECKPYGQYLPAKPEEILQFYLLRVEESARATARGEAVDKCTLNEVKVLVVGEPGVGKTDLTHWLKEAKPHPDPKTTVGIKIAAWNIPNSIGDDIIRCNVWDFGGQEIMQATHTFFLTERSLYLLVLDSRENEEQGKIRYWLDKIRAFGGDSPVIVVMNKIDEGQEKPDDRILKQEYPQNLIDRFQRTACRDGKWAKAGTGIDDLRTAITERVRTMVGSDHAIVPRSYLIAKFRIEKAAAELKKLDRARFELECDAANVPSDPAARSGLLSYLKNLGTVYHYARPGRPGVAARTFVLDPEWLSDGVYTILTNNELLESGGQLDPLRLKQIFVQSAAELKHHYSDEDLDFILELMEGDPFELCFRIPNRGDTRLVPERLPPHEPNHGITRENARNVEFHYEYLPVGLIPRFIVRMHEFLKVGDAWRSGVVLTIKGQRVVVRGLKEKKRVYVSTEGRSLDARYALSVVRDNLDAIHRAMKNVLTRERVPLPDNLDRWVTYTTLCDWEQDRDKGPSYEFTPDEAERAYSVQELLDEIEPAEARTQKRKRRVDVLGVNPSAREDVAAPTRVSDPLANAVPIPQSHAREPFWRSLIAPAVVAAAAVVLAALCRSNWSGWATMMYAVFVVVFGVVWVYKHRLDWRSEHWPKFVMFGFTALAGGGLLASVISLNGKLQLTNDLQIEINTSASWATVVGVCGAVAFGLIQYKREQRQRS